MSETFEEFRSSFKYGSRSDMSFKFLAEIGDEAAGEVIRRILEEAGALLDSGDPSPLIDHIVAAQAEAYRAGGLDERYHYDDAPFNRPTTPIAESRVGLVTSSGHFVDDPMPFGVADMTQAEAEARIAEFARAKPELSPIPVDTPASEIGVRHGGYDVRGARADHNVALPLLPLRDLAADGVIGSLHPTAYSFVGSTSQLRLRKSEAPAWAQRFREDIDVALLVPL